MKKLFYFLTLVAVIVLLTAAIIQSDFYRASRINISNVVSFSGALQWVITGGYLLTFVGMFMFGPIIISAAAFAAALGYFNIWLVFAIAVFGELAVDLILYAIGYFSRVAVVEKYGHFFGLSKEKMEKLEKLIHAHPGKTLTAIKLAPVLPVPGLMLVGSMRMPVKKFALINFLIAFFRAIVFIVIGYYFGQIYDSLSHYIKNAEYILFAGIIAVFGIFYAYKKITEKISSKLEKI
ncbi:MAG: VTT domain-containing protein [Candidatus Liptonbacteria bacterium]|nr:VTT domain-containing protein [Candidatus Liptonbacteria bacterium]